MSDKKPIMYICGVPVYDPGNAVTINTVNGVVHTCANCKHWNVFDLRCKEVGWPVAASHSCQKWEEKKVEKDCDCPPTCKNECGDCAPNGWYSQVYGGVDDD